MTHNGSGGAGIAASPHGLSTADGQTDKSTSVPEEI
jgi:hypothetical protein